MPTPAQYQKWLSRIADFAGWSAYETLFADSVTELDVTTFGWQRVEFHWSRNVPAGAVEDRAISKLDLVTMSDFGVYGSMDAALRATCVTALNTLTGTIMGASSNTHTLVEYRWYRMAFRNPITEQQRFAERGAPEAITPRGVAGSLSTSGEAGYQMATSVTFKTAARRHWGRMYLPGLDSGNLDTTGRLATAYVDNIANAYDTCFGALHAAGVVPFVPSTQVDNQLGAAAVSITEIQVDNVPDVIRKRRPKQTTYRKQINT